MWWRWSAHTSKYVGRIWVEPWLASQKPRVVRRDIWFLCFHSLHKYWYWFSGGNACGGNDVDLLLVWDPPNNGGGKYAPTFANFQRRALVLLQEARTPHRVGPPHLGGGAGPETKQFPESVPEAMRCIYERIKTSRFRCTSWWFVVAALQLC